MKAIAIATATLGSVKRVALSVRSGLAEMLTASAFIVGWLLITDGIGHLPHCAPAVVWRVSLGLLAMSLGGWKLFIQMAHHGLYLLTLDDRIKR